MNLIIKESAMDEQQPREAMIIYDNQTDLLSFSSRLARGHRDGASVQVLQVDLVVPIFQREVASRRWGGDLLYSRTEAGTTPPDDIEAIQKSKKVFAEGGCA